MGNSKINTKIERYIDLSLKFQKSAEDIFGKELVNHNLTMSYSVSGCTLVSNSYTQEQPKEKSRAEKIIEKAETEAKLAEDYDEYLKLQSELSQYFKALNKIEQ